MAGRKPIPGDEITAAMARAGSAIIEKARGPFRDDDYDEMSVARAVYTAMQACRGKQALFPRKKLDQKHCRRA